MLNTIWMDYDALAERLGIARESARQHVKRKQWPRRKDNQGRVQIGVPEECLPSEPVHVPEHDPEPVRVHEPDATAFMNRYIEKLEQALKAAEEKALSLERQRDEAVRDRNDAQLEAHALSAQVGALKTVLEVERQRVEEWRSVADRFASQAEAMATSRRSWWPFGRAS